MNDIMHSQNARQGLPDDVLSRWMETYGRSVHKALLRRNVPPSDAEDVEQNLWIKVQDHLDRGRPLPSSESEKRWLLGCAHYSAVDYLREQGKRRRAQEGFAKSGLARTDDVAFIDPIVEREEEALKLRMMAAVESLPPSLKRVVKLHLFNGCNLKEIAKHLHVHINTARNRKERALQAILKRFLEDFSEM